MKILIKIVKREKDNIFYFSLFLFLHSKDYKDKNEDL